jgi:DNA end-binding protein Ku
LEQTDLDRIQLETTRTIEIVQFAAIDELDPIYCNAPYYVAPDGPVAEEAFCVLRQAMSRAQRLAIGRLVLAGREHLIALKVEDKGFVLTTLRSAAEVRCSAAYFEDIHDSAAPDDQLQLAAQLIESRTAPLQAEQFTDRYQQALLEVIQAKIAGSAPVVVQQQEAGQVINFMEALKQSVAAASKAEAKAKRPARKTTARRRKAKSA